MICIKGEAEEKIMKANVFITLFLLSLCAFTANAQNMSDQDINLMAASLKAVDTYKAQGMSGLFNGMNNCYAQLKQKKTASRKDVEFCVAFDMSGVFLDYSMSQAGGFPRDQRFTDEVASSRMHIMLEQLGVSKGIADTQKYLGSRNERIQTYTNRAISLASDSTSKSETKEECVNRKMAKWEKKREKEIKKWCADLAKKGRECRISAGQDEAVRQEALEKYSAQCR